MSCQSCSRIVLESGLRAFKWSARELWSLPTTQAEDSTSQVESSPRTGHQPKASWAGEAGAPAKRNEAANPAVASKLEAARNGERDPRRRRSRSFKTHTRVWHDPPHCWLRRPYPPIQACHLPAVSPVTKRPFFKERTDSPLFDRLTLSNRPLRFAAGQLFIQHVKGLAALAVRAGAEGQRVSRSSSYYTTNTLRLGMQAMMTCRVSAALRIGGQLIDRTSGVLVPTFKYADVLNHD